MRLFFPAALAAFPLLVTACATPPDDVMASYVSPVLYQNLTCDQIGLEATRVSNRVAQMTGQQKKDATSDKVLTGVGIVVFWPALFFIDGDDATAAELARLKGEMDALQQASNLNGCAIQFTGPTYADAAAARKAEEAKAPRYPMNK